MRAATVSSGYRMTIPKEVREILRLQPGQKLGFLIIGKRVHLVPLRPIEELRGIAKGASMEGYREEVDEERWPYK